MTDKQALIAFFGGTFNPVHNGHVLSAKELQQVLSADQVCLVPCHKPPHREQPDVSSEQRMAMVELAVAEHQGLTVDGRELSRDRLSYTVDTLQHIREEYGADSILCWVMGADAFASIDRWHRWREILDFAHIVVIARPGETLPQQGELADWLRQHQLHDVAQLREKNRGGILLQALTPYSISATAIRQTIKEGRSARQDLPAPVFNYIEQHKLYRSQ